MNYTVKDFKKAFIELHFTHLDIQQSTEINNVPYDIPLEYIGEVPRDTSLLPTYKDYKSKPSIIIGCRKPVGLEELLTRITPEEDDSSLDYGDDPDSYHSAYEGYSSDEFVFCYIEYSDTQFIILGVAIGASDDILFEVGSIFKTGTDINKALKFITDTTVRGQIYD